MERLKKIKDTLLYEIENQLCGNLALVDTKELGEVVDMVKDLSEAIYYCEVTKAMQHSTVPETKEKMAQYAMPHTTPPIS